MWQVKVNDGPYVVCFPANRGDGRTTGVYQFGRVGSLLIGDNWCKAGDETQFSCLKTTSRRDTSPSEILSPFMVIG
jgi:hypothetical protein